MNPMSSAAVTLAIIGTAVCDAPAQYVLEGRATFSWEASIDGGATWTRGTLQVSPTQASVQVRASCAFTNIAPLCYFGYAEFDGTIVGVDGAGMGDWLSAESIVNQGPQFAIVGTRFGNLLKIDHLSDLALPGEGTRWVSVGQNSPSAGGPTRPGSFANPYAELLSYQLNFDGTPGDRLIGGVFRQFPTLPPDRNVIVWEWHGQFRTFAQQMTQDPLTIRVMPAPGVVVVAIVASCIAGRRRRPQE